MKTTCQELKTEYEELKALTKSFTADYTKLRETGDLTQLKRQKAKLTATYEALKAKLSVPLEVAIELMGEKEVLGPEDLKNTWGIELSPEEIPDIPFSREDLERAKELGQCLILRVDKTAEGKPMSMEAISNMMDEKWSKEGKGMLLNTEDGWKKLTGEDFFSKDAPRSGWALISREVLPDSLDKNYIEQTTVLIDTLKNKVFTGMEIPEEYTEAVEEFESRKEELTRLMSDDVEEALKQLIELNITKLTRQTLTEAIYDLAMYHDRNDERLLAGTRTWTSSRNLDGKLVRCGNFSGSGVGGGGWFSSIPLFNVGVSFSRRA